MCVFDLYLWYGVLFDQQQDFDLLFMELVVVVLDIGIEIVDVYQGEFNWIGLGNELVELCQVGCGKCLKIMMSQCLYQQFQIVWIVIDDEDGFWLQYGYGIFILGLVLLFGCIGQDVVQIGEWFVDFDVVVGDFDFVQCFFEVVQVFFQDVDCFVQFVLYFQIMQENNVVGQMVEVGFGGLKVVGD